MKSEIELNYQLSARQPNEGKLWKDLEKSEAIPIRKINRFVQKEQMISKIYLAGDQKQFMLQHFQPNPIQSNRCLKVIYILSRSRQLFSLK